MLNVQRVVMLEEQKLRKGTFGNSARKTVYVHYSSLLMPIGLFCLMEQRHDKTVAMLSRYAIEFLCEEVLLHLLHLPLSYLETLSQKQHV